MVAPIPHSSSPPYIGSLSPTVSTFWRPVGHRDRYQRSRGKVEQLWDIIQLSPQASPVWTVFFRAGSQNKSVNKAMSCQGGASARTANRVQLGTAPSLPEYKQLGNGSVAGAHQEDSGVGPKRGREPLRGGTGSQHHSSFGFLSFSCQGLCQ